MKAKRSVILALLCIPLLPVALYAIPQKPAAKKVTRQPIVEYCVFVEHGNWGQIEYPDGTKTEFKYSAQLVEIQPAVELTKLARSGWRVVSSSATPGGRYWTLERRR